MRVCSDPSAEAFLSTLKQDLLPPQALAIYDVDIESDIVIINDVGNVMTTRVKMRMSPLRPLDIDDISMSSMVAMMIMTAAKTHGIMPEGEVRTFFESRDLPLHTMFQFRDTGVAVTDPELLGRIVTWPNGKRNAIVYNLDGAVRYEPTEVTVKNVMDG